MKYIMRTWTGQLSPLPAHGSSGLVCPFDIVMHLGRESRFGNSGDKEFSVLHHSVLVAMIWMRAGYPQEEAIYALAHDFHEAYTGDIPSPIKNLTPDVKKAISKVEGMLDGKIYEYMGIEPPDKEIKKKVKLCDTAALIIESMITGPPGMDDIERLRAAYPDPEVWSLVENVMPNLSYVSASVRQKLPDRNAECYNPEGEVL
jgi:hypothetical protein